MYHELSCFLHKLTHTNTFFYLNQMVVIYYMFNTRNKFKKIFFISVFLYPFMLFSSSSSAQDLRPVIGGEVNPVAITLSDRELNFRNDPFLIDGQVMVPARIFFDNLHAKVFWDEPKGLLYAYKDNLFIKFELGSQTALINGAPVSISVAPLVHRGSFFVPLEPIVQAYNLRIETAFRQHLSIDYRQEALQYRRFGHHHFKRIQLLNKGVSFYIPEFWASSDTQPNMYYFDTPFEKYTLNISIMRLTEEDHRQSVVESYIYSLDKEYSQIEIEEIRHFKPLDYVISAIYYHTVEEDEVIFRADYIFFEDQTAYIFRGEFSESADAVEARFIFDTIASTFQISKITVNQLLEHYVEFAPFFKHEMKLGIPVYSNMLVHNRFLFNGHLLVDEDQNHELKILVEKENEFATYTLPIQNQRFNAPIYTPFGLGKHNITVYLVEKNDLPTFPEYWDLDDIYEWMSDSVQLENQMGPDQKLMQFSVINTSNEKIKHRLPSEYIAFDKPDVYLAANRITHSLSSEYEQVKALYEWVFYHYDYIDRIPPTGFLSVEQMIQETEGNSLELTVLYAGLVRSVDIPARIVRGSSEGEEESYFWVETFINGRWLVSDIVKDLQERQNPLDSHRYFNINRTRHYERFEQIEVVPF